MTEVKIVTPEQFSDYLTEADSHRFRIMSQARLAYARAQVEAEKAWIASMGARLGWQEAQ